MVLAPETNQKVNGYHWQAYAQQEQLYRAILRALHDRNPSLNILDFGCGKYGVGRTIFEGIMNIRDRLHLYDPHASIDMPMDNRTQILSREELFGDDSVSCDLVNISYVLCLLEPEEARSILNELRNGQSNAVFAIVDYTLQNRTRAEVLGLLSAHEEKKWREKLGDDEFVRTHTRFTHKSLCALLRSAGLCPLNEELSSLDPAGIRSAIIAHPQ